MKILIVSPNLPGPGGGASTRNYHLLRALTKEHTISLLALTGHNEKGLNEDLCQLLLDYRLVHRTLAGTGRSKRLGQLIHALRGRSAILQEHLVETVQVALDEMLAKHLYDAVLFESSLMAGYRVPRGVRVIIDQHNLEFELLERAARQISPGMRKWYNWREARLIRPVELERCRRADLILVTSEREQVILKSLLPRIVIGVVPNGVDTDLFSPGQKSEVAGQIIFTGSMDYYPNTSAALFFAHQCWPQIRSQVPDASWQIVGKEPSVEVRQLGELPGVTVTGSVPSVPPYLAEAQVALAPLLIGGGTRLKILEALAMGKAVVSTTQGCEGLEIVSGQHLLIEDQPNNLARSVVRLLQDADQRTRLGKAGRALAEKHYSWHQCGNRLLHLLDTTF